MQINKPERKIPIKSQPKTSVKHKYLGWPKNEVGHYYVLNN